MKTKKIPYYLLVGPLTLGASLILGFLSFTGAMALWPIIPVASIFFGLSIAYEGEIYLQNIKGALDKLGFKGNFMQRKLARSCLAELILDKTNQDSRPLFVTEYIKMLKLKDLYKKEGQLNPEDRKRKKVLNKAIKKKEKWFAELLFQRKAPIGEVEKELVGWLSKNNLQSDWLKKLQKRQYYYYLAAGFASIAGLSMTFGTTYLLLGALSSVPVIMVAPPLLLTVGIVVASLVAGFAYGLLTFNTVTDIIDNDTIQNWFKKLKQNLIEKPSVRSVMVSSVALALFTLALALTICTAGTWWTVIKQTPPLFRWMAKIPALFLMAFPMINGAAALSFNFQNTAESFKMVDDVLNNLSSKSSRQRLSDAWNNFIKNESFWQRLNPFRILLKLTFTPLRLLFFLGHLVSIALTSDRLPGVPQIVSFLVGLICEGFEDAHYFLGFGGPDGHNHDNDLPTRALYFIFTPLFCLAALWDYSFSTDKDWQKSFRKFKLSRDAYENESVKKVKIDSSLHLSKLGVHALKSYTNFKLCSKGIDVDANQKNPLVTKKTDFLKSLQQFMSKENCGPDACSRDQAGLSQPLF